MFLLFVDSARRQFAAQKIPGEFYGIDVTGDMNHQTCFFIYRTADGQIHKTEWPEAALYSEGAFRSITECT